MRHYGAFQQQKNINTINALQQNFIQLEFDFMKSIKELLVIQYKTLLMQRLADLVQRGYQYYVTGEVTQEKALVMAEKFSNLYFILDNVARRSYKKRLGQGNAFLLLADLYKSGKLQWWLFITPGTHPAHGLEKLFDAHDRAHRVRLTGYELVRLSKAKDDGGRVRWTWRMTDDKYLEWQGAIVAAVRAKNPQTTVPLLIISLYQTPGFGQARVQVGKLASFLKKEWLRSARKATDLVLPEKLHYVRRMPNNDYTLSDWLKDQKGREK